MSKMRIEPSSPPAASHLPLGSKAVAATSATMRTSHIRTIPSASAEAMVSPRRAKLTELMEFLCP
eukprot:scaffold201763_cov30-Tisochrysis_lutea.AAC.2